MVGAKKEVTYAELVRMDEDKLAVKGWTRNEKGGITRIRAGSAPPIEPPDQALRKTADEQKCGGCAAAAMAQKAAAGEVQSKTAAPGTKTLGLLSMIRAKTGEKVDERSRRSRLALCMSCQEVTRGTPPERLYREIDKKSYCGVPRSLLQPSSLVRDEVADGCGCELGDKTRWWKAKCPRDRWGEGPTIGSSTHVVVPAPRTPLIEKGVIDIRPRSVDSTQYTGIGDYIAAIPVVHAVAVARDERVRMRCIESRVEWAQIGWPDCSLDYDDQDIAETVIDINKYGACELDILLEESGMNRHEYWFQIAGVPEYRPKIEITHDAQLWVREQVAKPKREGKKIVIIAPFANVSTRQWPLHHWIDLVEELQEKGHHVALIDSEPQRGRYIPCQRFWGWRPSHIAALIAAGDLYVGNDSGMTHLAGILEAPAIALCSATNAKTVFGWYKNMTGLQAVAPCTACLWRKERGFKRSCHTQCAAMWDGLPVKTVLAECDRLLA